jgi:hypothetical protein
MSSDKQSQYNLWHLFSTCEAEKKMSTILRGGLWCAELNSIPAFVGDVEGSQPYGIFVSCWHKSDGDPSDKAWQVFGNSGDGVALRAKPSFMLSLANQFSTGGLTARFDQVCYLINGQQVTDAAFEVAPSHNQEEEMRVALFLTEITDRDTRARKEQIRKIAPVSCPNRQAMAEFRSLTYVEDDGDDAIILPISAADLIEEIVIGSKVCENDRSNLLKMLQGSGLTSKIRRSDAS